MSSEPRRTDPRRSCEAAYEAEIKRLRVEHVLLDNVVALANLGMRRTGLAPGTEDERDPAQVRLAIEAIRALMPLLEQSAPAQVAAVRDAVSRSCRWHTSGSAGDRRLRAVRPEAAHRKAVSSQSVPAPTRPRAGAPAEARRAGPRPAQRPSLGARPIA